MNLDLPEEENEDFDPKSPTRRKRLGNLSTAQWEVIEVCARLTQVVGMARSVGEILGFVLSAPNPVTFEDVVAGLGISNGSASHGLRYLRRLGALKVSFYARDRRDFYEMETSLRKLVNGYLTETFVFHLGGLDERLQALGARIKESPDASTRALGDRVNLLIDWNLQARSAINAALGSLP